MELYILARHGAGRSDGTGGVRVGGGVAGVALGVLGHRLTGHNLDTYVALLREEHPTTTPVYLHQGETIVVCYHRRTQGEYIN